MVSKNNKKLIAEKNRRNEKQRFAIRKLNIGVASVLLGITFSIYGGGQAVAHADTDNASDQPEEAKTTNEQSLADQSQVTLNNNAQTDNSVTAGETNKAATNQQPVGGATKSTDATDTPATTTNNEKVTANEATAQKTAPASQGQSTNADQNQNSLDGTRQARQNISNTALYRNNTNSVASPFGASFVATPTSEATTDNNSVTVSDAKGLIDAIQNGTATTINVGADIDLGEKTNSNYTSTNISNKRNITIQSADDKHYTVDFNGYGFNMYSNDYGVTFKDLDLYGRSYYGIVRSAGSYTFDNVNYTGSQLIYTDSKYNTTVNFDGNVTAHSVGSYTSPLNNKSQASQGGNTQQVIQFAAGTNTINFNSGSNVTLTTTNSNVLEVDGGKTTINVKNGAQVSLNPHTQSGPEQISGMNMDGIARGIASKGDTTLNIDQGGNLDINLTKNTEDKYLSSALYLNSGATINVNGNLNINSDGTPYYRYQGWDDPVYINGNTAINVNGGSFKVNATNMGDYKGSVVTSNGNSTIAISHHGTFDVTGDGTQATGVSLGSGSIFTSTQPELFDISMPDGATAIKNGKVQFKGVKTSADGQPIGEIDITYVSDGTPTVTKVTSYDEATTTATRTAGNKAKNKIKLVAAGEEVNLSDVKFIKNADGTYTMSGDANTTDKKGAYVYISVNGKVHQVAPTDSQTLWTAEATGDPASSQVPYTAETGADGKFTVNLGKLKDTDQVSVYGAKDFVTSDTDTKTVSEWMTNSYRDQLQKLVDEAPTVEEDANFTSAGTEQKNAYTTAISNGNTLLQNTSATSEQLQDAIKAIDNAKNGLNGDLINSAKQALEAAVKDASNVRNTPTYYNGSKKAQTAYNSAINAGQAVLNEANPSASEVKNALDAINAAKDNLKGEATSTKVLEKALTNANNAKETGNYTNADQTNQEALNNAITAGQDLLKNTNATQAQVDSAAKAITKAINGLNGDTNLAKAKTAATEDIQKALDTKTTQITDATNIDQTTKDQLIKEATDAANTAKDVIKKATTNDVATKAGQAGVEAINNVKIPSLDGAKQAASQAIDQALDTKTKEINAANNIDQTTKDQLIKEATDAANTAKDVIKKATTNDVATKAGQAGVEAINNVKIPSLDGAKQAANQAIDQALDTKTKEINAANNIDQTTKDQLIKEAADAANTAKNVIEKATTNDVATKAGQAGVEAINNVKIPSLDGAKQAASQAIDQALDTKTKEINAANNIDQTTKDQLIKEATDAATTAKDAIEKSTTNDEATKAGQAGVEAINNVKVPSVTDSQNAAKEVIDAALNAKTKEINDANNIDQTTKDQLIKEATDAANNAKEAIDQATTADAIKTARDEGTTNINNVTVPSLEDAKKAATKAVDDALTAQTEVINKADNLSDTEKKDLIDQATAEATTAKDAIEKATTNNEAAQAGQAGVDAIKKIVPTSLDTVKSDANKAIEAALTKKLEEINSANALTTDEKTALTQEANTAADKAKEEITNATTNDAVIEAQNNGVTAIDGIKVPTESAVKEAAKKAVADAATVKNNAIDASNLTNEEKATLKQKVTEAQTAADQAIDNATTNTAVTEAQNNGVNAINGINVPSASTTKEQAKTDLNKAVDEAKKAIDQDNNLTDEKKQAAKDQIDSDAKTAQEAINNAKTNDDVKKAAADGTLAIDKDVANAAIDNAVAGKKAEISNSPLTDEEKTALNNEVDQKAKDAKEAINTAATPEDVTTAQENGIKNINDIDVPTESAAKQAAKKAVAEAATAKTNAIDSSNLTDEEKAALKQKVTEAQTAADQAIDNATTNADVTKAKDNGIKAINGIDVPAKSDAKEKATTDLNNEVENAKNAIDQDSNLTDEQKQAAKAQIDSDAKTAQDAINNAKTNDDVKKAAADGTLAIDKGVANAAIDNAVAGKKAEISKSPLTAEEKDGLNKEVDQKAQAAQEAIKAATTPEAVATAQGNGIKNINDIDVPTESAAKQAAKAAVAKVADEKSAAIDSSNLTAEEKAALKQEVTKAQNAANTAIDNATTNAAVTEAEDKGIKAINGIDVPAKSNAKEKAITDLNTAVENAKKAIDQDSNLTDEQKQAAKAQIDSDAKTAQDAINNAKTDNDVNNAVNSGKVAIDKAVANAAIDNAVAGKLKEIQDPLTTEEKQAYTDLINSEANNAKQNIANATTVEEVTTAQTNGVDEITNTEIPTTSSAKDKAIAAINDALQKKTDEINNASNINTQEKTDLIKQATEAANTAKNNINNATTNAAVDTAQTNGEKAIADVTVPNLSDVKKESIDLVNKALDAKTAEINNASNLSQDEKQSLINDATNAATEAINNINQSQTNDDAKAAATTGVQNIENVTIPTLDDAKKNANQAIDDALKSKVNEINNASNLNETEKQKLVDQATEAAATAKANVEKATTNDDARDATNAGIDNIKGISFTSLEDAKKTANAAIDNALQVKTDEINNASNLSTEEKQDLINQASKAAKNAKDNINNATTNDAVTDAQNKGIVDIANVTVPSLDQVKQDAINAIKQVQDAKNKQIAAASNLSAEEQKELTDQVDKIANDAIAKINESSTTTNDAVTATRDDAIKQITDLFIPTLDGAQTDALNAIESAKNAKLTDINNATHLTDQEKQALVDQTNKAADDATKEIKGAQTNDAVKSAETAGLDNINNITIPTLVQKQQEAIEELNAARDAKNSAIDNAPDLTTDEKNALKDKVQAEYSNAVSNITSATTDEAVTTAKENGIAAIKDIQIPTKSAAKDQATTDLNTAVDEAKKAIDQDSNLTDEEKQAAKDQIDSDAKKAQEAINNAKTDDEVNSALDNGKLAIDKDIANAAIDNAVAGKKDEIAKSPLTDEEKTALNNEVDQKAQDAKEAINNATTPEAVTTVQDNGIKNINDTEVPTESTAKEAAKKAIAEAAEAKNNAIDSSNLTDEEKAALKQEVTDAQNAANTAIDNATTNAAVTEAEDNGIKAINGIEIPTKSPAKDQATTDLNDAVDEAKKAIDQDNNLTDAEKQAAKDQIDSDAKKAQEAIDNAKTDDEVKTAVDNGKLAIDKDVANAAIDNAVAGKKAEIAKAPLTTDEAKDLNDLVDQEAKAAKKAIDSATTIPAVDDAKNTGVAAINNIAVPTTSSTKDQANQTIDDALANKTKEINDATNLSDKQKQDLIDQANEEAAKAKENIKNATSNEAVNKATTDGVNAIANVTVPSLDDAKKDASQLIDDVLKQKEDEINNASHLTDQEKQDLINQAQNAADEAKDKIDQATTNDDVATERDAGAEKIANIVVPSLDDAKKASTKVIDEVLKEKTAEINAATNLSNTEKDALIKDATTAANTAKDNIAKATTNDAVKDAETDGVKAILDIKVPGREDQQKDAIAALDRALADKVSEIDNANNLSETTKQDLKQQAQAAYTTAVDNVNNAQTSAEINAARDNGVQAILDITIPTLTDAQDASITAVEQVRDAKKTQIEAAKNLTETQKEALKNQVDEIADKAIDNIKNATTDATVKDAETAGINEILNVTIPTLDAAKSDAKQAIADALTAKTAEINAAQNLTDAEKQKLIDQAQTEATAANKNIDAATTNDAAELAAKNGVQAILDIQVPTVEETRDQAKKNVDNALNSKKEEINNSNLSPVAKEALINEAEQAAENARTAIDNATTASAISEAEAAGIAAIENIKVSNAPTESDNSSNHQTNTETPTEDNSTSQNNNNATQAPVQGNNTQADLTGSHGTNLTTGQQTEKAADTNSKETLPQTGNETERGLSIAGLAIASLLGLFGLSGLGKKRD
ncbi:YSIRK signal domain/LPXTG anchor domain surface protein [Limosilactobacillus reuteri]|uniref:LPXTG-motif cell wall anchor domain protein n=4 Tax=Limosilactobacillus reuteri TaxID=1598 RepID=B3XPA3_LIMR1|nr:YSIRK signal domain/LPXTG anchor domain surface protein [Limosilactobacillus reuteri]EDX43592.1 LPXTG-motif cell wall anchor domain protein [Limosilactobacillus reuteri subsp. rodentium]